MATIKIGNIVELENVINKCIEQALDNWVVPNVQADFVDNAQTYVYDTYPEPKYPFYYQRSYRFTDPSTYNASKTGKTEVEITVNHPQAELVEYGHGEHGSYYEFPFNREGTEDMFLRPRPYYSETVGQLKNGNFKKYIVEGLKKQGLSVK